MSVTNLGSYDDDEYIYDVYMLLNKAILKLLQFGPIKFKMHDIVIYTPSLIKLFHCGLGLAL